MSEKFPKRYWINDSNHHLDEECPDILDRKPCSGPPLWQSGFKQYLSLQEHQAKISQLEERLRIAEEALSYCERRTDPEQKNPVEDHYIRSTRLRGVVVKALAAIKEKNEKT